MKFFLVALPGLEDLVAAELSVWFPDLTPSVEHGGVTVDAPMNLGLSMNFVLKTPTRILLRVSEFKCRDFPKLFNKIKKIEWNHFVDSSYPLQVQVSSRKSRLNMKNRIEKTCLDAWGNTEKKEPALNLYVRFHDDVCTLSLDTSGERLHKRGQRKHIGEAPLRENIAAALIQMIQRHAEAGPVEIIDPMMGSGSFLLEAATQYDEVESRDFPHLPFRVDSNFQLPSPERPFPIENLIGYEKDPKTLDAARENLKGLNAKIIESDFFAAKALERGHCSRWLLCNPPYGERLKVKGDLKTYYEELLAASEKVLRPDWACYLFPSKAIKGKLKLPKNWKVKEKRPFVNGGLNVTAFLFASE